MSGLGETLGKIFRDLCASGPPSFVEGGAAFRRLMFKSQKTRLLMPKSHQVFVARIPRRRRPGSCPVG